MLIDAQYSWGEMPLHPQQKDWHDLNIILSLCDTADVPFALQWHDRDIIHSCRSTYLEPMELSWYGRVNRSNYNYGHGGWMPFISNYKNGAVLKAKVFIPWLIKFDIVEPLKSRKIVRKYILVGLVQDCSNPTANALELLQPCTKPLLYLMKYVRGVACAWICCGYRKVSNISCSRPICSCSCL